MNLELVTSLAGKTGQMEPPGCVSVFVDRPSDNRGCLEVGFVLEHRFAFYYWIACYQRLHKQQKSSQKPPDLVTWDWHDDCGADSDVQEDRLALLNQADTEEVAFFCWAGLCRNNDGHILPAVWLNVIGNVYIVQKQKQDCRKETREIRDRFGNLHRIRYFRSLKDFPRAFEDSNSGTGVIWDIDLDYFTQGRSVADQIYTPSMSGEQIAATLSPDTAWMPLILRDLKAITVALEPSHTGGLSRSLEIYRHWEAALFSAPLFGKNSRWRKGLARGYATSSQESFTGRKGP